MDDQITKTLVTVILEYDDGMRRHFEFGTDDDGVYIIEVDRQPVTLSGSVGSDLEDLLESATIKPAHFLDEPESPESETVSVELCIGKARFSWNGPLDNGTELGSFTRKLIEVADNYDLIEPQVKPKKGLVLALIDGEEVIEMVARWKNRDWTFARRGDHDTESPELSEVLPPNFHMMLPQTVRHLVRARIKKLLEARSDWDPDGNESELVPESYRIWKAQLEGNIGEARRLLEEA